MQKICVINALTIHKEEHVQLFSKITLHHGKALTVVAALSPPPCVKSGLLQILLFLNVRATSLRFRNEAKGLSISHLGESIPIIKLMFSVVILQ